MPAQLGRYRPFARLGKGALGEVFLARVEGDGGFQKLYALKTTDPAKLTAPKALELFLAEARIAARIDHPNVVAVHELAEHQGQYFLVMDYVPGETLGYVLGEAWHHPGGLPGRLAAYIIAQAADGMHAAHELTDGAGAPLELVHRDLSPNNILIGFDGSVRVTDFGVAKSKDQVMETQHGTVLGTAPYMAPEQAQGEPLDRRADIFALGTLLWESLTGRHLFRREDLTSTTARILFAEIPPPHMVRAGIHPALSEIVMKCLDRRIDRRYPTAKALAEALTFFLFEQRQPVRRDDLAQFLGERFSDRAQRRAQMLSQAEAGDTPEPMALHLGDARPLPLQEAVPIVPSTAAIPVATRPLATIKATAHGQSVEARAPTKRWLWVAALFAMGWLAALGIGRRLRGPSSDDSARAPAPAQVAADNAITEAGPSPVPGAAPASPPETKATADAAPAPSRAPAPKARPAPPEIRTVPRRSRASPKRRRSRTKKPAPPPTAPFLFGGDDL